MNRKILIKGFLIVAFLIVALPVAAQVQLPNPLGTDSIGGVIQKVADYIATTVGGLAVIMFIYAGIVFLTSAGNPSRVEQAKRIVLWAVIGVAIALLGSSLVNLVTTILGA